MKKELVEKVIFENILGRRSVRKFKKELPERDKILKILEAGIWAPSGLNNQPWRFVIISSEEKKQKLAELTKYKYLILGAPILIGVFLDRDQMYHQIKDHQSAGACIQNILLYAHALGLGTCWIGEILKNEEKVKEVLELSSSKYELCALIAVGYPDDPSERAKRAPLKDFILKEV